MSEEQVKQEKPEQSAIPETISKSTVIVSLILCILCGMLGFAFGADAGYNKGFQDCTQHRTLDPVSLENP